MNSVPLAESHTDEIEKMDDPRVLEADALREIERKTAKLEVLENVLEQRQRVLNRAGS